MRGFFWELDKNIDKALEVHKMFSAIANRYDVLNSLLSFGLDHLWRREAAKAALEDKVGRILDVATGTADLAISLKRCKPSAEGSCSRLCSGNA